ncbi:MAG TPA: choice-of-anchor D domain-containing protein [Candidatus Kapabacteria bacterium]
MKMNHFDRFMRFLVVLAAATLFASLGKAQSFTYYPDTLRFTPNNQDSMSNYVRIAYAHDSSGPGTHIHCWISDGSTYFSCSHDTTFTRSYFYRIVGYRVASDTVYGQLSISDDTVTRTVVLIGYPNPPAPALQAEGPYFPNIAEGHDTCSYLRLVNTSSHPDTISYVSWKHNPNGIFTWDSTSLPTVLGAHDTTFWTYCFHAPDNTTLNIDTLVIYYNGTESHLTRIVEGQATASTDGELTALGPYFPENTPEGKDTCTTLRLINSGSNVDTITSISWSHDPNGIFTESLPSIPYTLGAHDTVFWSYCFDAPQNTETYTDTIVIDYHDAASLTRHVTRIVSARATDTTPPDGELTAYGPYFSEVVDEGHDTCTTMRLINTGSDADTLWTAGWTHSTEGIFSWDSVSIPTVINAHDTVYWTFCYHAPNDTNVRVDTFSFRYSDAYNNDRHLTRVVAARATDPSIVTCYILYPQEFAVTNVGDTSRARLFISNRLSASVTLTSIHISGTDDASFRIDSTSFPNTIAANAYDSLWLSFIPRRTTGSTEYNATITATFTTDDTAHCHEATASLVGYMAQPCTDTETVDFDTSGMDDISVYGDSTRYYAHRVDFINNSNAALIISSVGWTHSSDHFLIVQTIPATPDTVQPGATFAIVFHFYGDSTGNIYRDTIALTIQNGITIHSKNFIPLANGPGTFLIAVNGLNAENPAASVPEAPQPIALNLELYPNPTSGTIYAQLDGTGAATYQIYDLLGNVLATHTGTGLWQWDPNGIVADGTYFIRASNGTTIVTKRFVIER